MPVLWRCPQPVGRRPRDVASVRELPRGGRARPDGALLSAECAHLRRCLLVQLPEYVAPEAIFTEYAYFSSFSDSFVQHAAEYVAQVVDRLGPGRGELRGRAGEQRRLPAPALRRAEDPRSRGRARPERRRRSRRARSSHPDRLLRRGDCKRVAAGREGGGSDHRQQRPLPGPSPERLHRRDEDAPRPGGNGHGRVPAPDAAHRGEPLRHRLPRALHVLLALHRRARLRRPRPDGRRPRRDLDPRRIAPAVPRARRAGPRALSGRGVVPAAGSGGRAGLVRDLPGFPRTGSRRRSGRCWTS